MRREIEEIRREREEMQRQREEELQRERAKSAALLEKVQCYLQYSLFIEHTLNSDSDRCF